MKEYIENGIFVKAGRRNFIKTRIAIAQNKINFRRFIGK